MNFFGNKQPATQPSGFSFGLPSTPKTTAATGTSLFGGQPTSSAAGFGLQTASSQPATGLGFSTSGGLGAAGQSKGLFGTPAPSAPASSGFSFSTPAASKAPAASTGFSFSTPAASTAAGPGFSFSSSAAPTSAAPTPIQPSSNFSFTSSATPAAPTSQATSGFSFSTAASTTATKPAAGFGLGAPATQPTTGFSLPSSTSAATTTQTTLLGGGLSLNPATNKPTETATSGFKLGGLGAATASKPAAAATATTGFSLSANKPAGDATKSTGLFDLAAKKPAASASLGGLGLASTATTTAASSGFQLSATTSSAAANPLTGFSLGGSTAGVSAAAKTGGLLGLSTSTASPSTGLKLGLSTATAKPSTTATSAATAGFSLGGVSTGAAISKSSAASASSATTTTTAAGSDSAPGTLKFKELEIMINKWTNELEQQERLFIDQATHVNGWNKLLIDNSHKIMELHGEFEKMQCDQERLNQDLDFIKTQQQELEDLIRPLEETLRQQSASHVPSIHTNHADLEREKTYGLVANIDGQLKHMCGDMREIIDHVNATTLPTDNTNPINQISKILSAHMDSLQWLDSNSNSLERKLDDLSKQVNDRKQEQESKFRLAFD